MKQMKSRLRSAALTLAFLAAPIATHADELRIQSLDNTGGLTFNRIPTGQAYRVECATSLTGVWTRLTNAVTVDGIPTTMDCIPGKGGIATGAVPVQASSMFFRAVAETNDMVFIPAGGFIMGATHETCGDDLPQHFVYVNAFYMDRYEATQERWGPVYTWATNHGYMINYGRAYATNHPLVGLCWQACATLCNARSEMEGLTPCYMKGTNVYKTGYSEGTYVDPCACNWNANGYRLPTEAEWEKAARGGVSGHRFPWSDVDTIQQTRANYYANTNYSYDTNPTAGYHPAYTNTHTSPVGSFAPNGFGLYDMAGNLEEWLWDYYSSTYYSTSPTNNPHGPNPNPIMWYWRGLRGGSWMNVRWHPGEWCVYVRSADKMKNADIWRTFRSVRACTNSPTEFPPVTNHSPVILEGASVSVTMSEDGSPEPFRLTLHATDADNDAILWMCTPASHGRAAADGNGACIAVAYTPEPNYNGSDSFVVRAYDTWGAMASIIVNVTIQPVNDLPVANAQVVNVATNTSRAITLTGFDLEGSNIVYTVSAQPTHGALSGTPPNITYMPFLDYKGPDSFMFKVNDGATDSVASATVTLWVNAMAAQGGTMTNYTANGTNYTAHIFTTVGNTSLVVAAGGAVEVLVVAGGGGAVENTQRIGGGGGGAGGLIYTNLALAVGSHTVTVGAGGVGGSDSATEGLNSVFDAQTAYGGGGGKLNAHGAAGGSGAGGYGKGYAGGAGSQPGGYANSGGMGGPNPGGGGGGGGAGSAGCAGATNNVGGNGGAGRSYDISGVMTGYAGGGGGGGGFLVGVGGTATDGGGSVQNGGAGKPNTGGGGGCEGGWGGAGGSGIVIVRYGIAVP